MERVAAEYYQKALRNFRIADHLLMKTYKFVQDPKLLLTVIENLFLAMGAGMSSILAHEYHHKRIPPPGSTFDAKVDAMRMYIVRRHNLRPEDITVAQELKNIVLAHKKSPVEFVRNGCFVICGENYQLQPVGANQVERYHRRAKIFIDQIGTIIQ